MVELSTNANRNRNDESKKRRVDWLPREKKEKSPVRLRTRAWAKSDQMKEDEPQALVMSVGVLRGCQFLCDMSVVDES